MLQGIGCYMFRIIDMEVVDATMKRSAVRFINHSCDVSCDTFTKVLCYSMLQFLCRLRITRPTSTLTWWLDFANLVGFNKIFGRNCTLF